MKLLLVLLIFVVLAAHCEARKKCFAVDSAPAPEPEEPPEPKSQSDCGKHEEFDKCTSKCGEPSCRLNKAFYCGLGCEAKCLCKEGYVRDYEEKCVKFEDCPAPPKAEGLVID